MTESQMYQLASAVSDLTYDTGAENISPGFYENAVRIAEDPAVEDVRERDLDNVVIDPSVVLQAYANTTWESGFDVADERIFDAMDDIYGTDLAYHFSPDKGPDDQVIGSFRDEVEPEEVFESLGDIDADLHYPDHMLDCINGKYSELKQMFRNDDLEYDGQDFTQVKDDINEVRGQIWTGLKQSADQLPVMKNSGSFESYSNTNFNNKDFSEDDLIEKEAKRLDGNTAVATFDAGFIDRDVVGLPPQLIRQMWG